MNATRYGILGCALCICAVNAFAQADPPAVAIDFNDAGLSALTFDGTQLLANGKLSVENVYFTTESGEVMKSDLALGKETVDRDARTIKKTWAWGEILCAYTVKDNRLDATVTITNTSARAISSVEMTLFSVKFPKKPSNFVYPPIEPNIGGPTILRADYGTGNMVLCNEDFFRRLHFGIPWAEDNEKTVYPVVVDTGRRARFADFFANIQRPIYPNGNDHYHISLRFGKAGTTESDLAPDVIARYRTAFPATLKWPDRRPIAALFLSSSETGAKGNNPRGWFLDKKLDITTVEGMDAFKEKLLKFADDSIRVMKDADAQGAIVWDTEGQEFPHATSYLGDPRSLPTEMEPLADQFFAKFKAAGLRIGVCVRPQLPVRHPYANDVRQIDVRDIFQNLNEKITYASKRWGCTLFYVDSDIDHDLNGRIVHDPLIFKKLAEAHPDVLLIPEHANIQHYAYTAPYKELRLGFSSAPDYAVRVYPDAFSVIYVADGPVDEKHAELVQAVKRGDILLFRGWWDDPFNAKMKAIYQEAKQQGSGVRGQGSERKD